MISKYAIAREAAAQLTSRHRDAIADRYLSWIEAQVDQKQAAEALVASAQTSKDPDVVLAVAAKTYRDMPTSPDAAALEAGEPGTVLMSSDEGEIVWNPLPDAKSLFRGAWASLSTLKVESFASGTLPSDFTIVGQPGKVTMASVGGTNPPPGSHIRIQNVSVSTAGVQLTVPTGVTKLSWWWAMLAGQSNAAWTRLDFKRNGGAASVSLATVSQSWVQASADVVAGDVVTWTQFDSASWSADTRVGYIEYLGPSTAAPYMLGEFVTHAGQMWRSKVDNNTQEPSKTSNAWETALMLPSPTGTTAQRPAPAAAGVGFLYYDTTLKKPIWSTGTGWVDAAGVNA